MSYNLSIWEKNSYWFDRDYVIVGGGITGLMAAIHIASIEPNASVCVVEAQAIGTLASSRNAGFACFGSISELESDKDIYGLDKTLEIVEMRYKGLQLLRSIIGDRFLKYEESGGTEVFDGEASFNTHADQIAYWNNNLSSITASNDTFSVVPLQNRLNFHSNIIHNSLEGLIDTGELMKSIVRKAEDLDIDIYRGLILNNYNCRLGGVDLYFNQIEDLLRCRQLVLCTNSLTQHIVPEVDVIPSRNQVIVTSKVDTTGMSGGYHFDAGYTYFRALNGRILLGGARNRFPQEDNTSDLGLNQSNIDHLVEFLKIRILKQQDFTIEHHWSGILSGGSDRTPIVKRMDDHVTVAARLGGMGVAIGSIVGQEAATLAVKQTF